MNGWIKLHRKIKEWEWYQDANTFRVFIHLLIEANHEPTKWRGKDINRGQVLTGRKQLSAALDISEQSIRTAIARLKSTNELTSDSTNQFTIYTLSNYNKYQDIGDQATSQPGDQPTNESTSQLTSQLTSGIIASTTPKPNKSGLIDSQPTSQLTSQLTTSKKIRKNEVKKERKKEVEGKRKKEAEKAATTFFKNDFQEEAKILYDNWPNENKRDPKYLAVEIEKGIRDIPGTMDEKKDFIIGEFQKKLKAGKIGPNANLFFYITKGDFTEPYQEAQKSGGSRIPKQPDPAWERTASVKDLQTAWKIWFADGWRCIDRARHIWKQTVLRPLTQYNV